MSAEENTAQMVDQVVYVMTAAREHFADSLETFARGMKDMDNLFSPEGKHRIEQLFSEAFNTYAIAEVTAILCYLIHKESDHSDMLKRTIPEFLDLYEKRMAQVPESLSKKTQDLPRLAENVLDSGTNKDTLTLALLKDLSKTTGANHLRASFDAALLNFLGE